MHYFRVSTRDDLHDSVLSHDWLPDIHEVLNEVFALLKVLLHVLFEGIDKCA